MEWQTIPPHCMGLTHYELNHDDIKATIWPRYIPASYEAYIKIDDETLYANFFPEGYNGTCLIRAKEWIENIIVIITPDDELPPFKSSLELMDQRLKGEYHEYLL